MLQVTDHAGKVTFEALDSKAVEARKKAVLEAYEKAEKARQESGKDEPKLAKPAFSVLKDAISGKDAKEKAEAEAARHKEEHERKLKEKGGGT